VRRYWPGPREGEFLTDALAVYRANFDPASVAAELKRLDEEHTRLWERWRAAPTPRTKAKAKADLDAMEARIEELGKLQQDAGAAITTALRELRELAQAVHDAKEALAGAAGERALRQRAEAVRAVVQRIECTFAATGQTGGGWGKKNARLVKVTVYPVAGDSVEFSADAKGTLLYSSAHSCI
jgi:hypothetical protein